MHHSVRGFNVAVLTNDFGIVSAAGYTGIDDALLVEFIVVDTDLKSVEARAQRKGIFTVGHRNRCVALKGIEQDRSAGNGMRQQDIVRHGDWIIGSGHCCRNIGVHCRKRLVGGYENRNESLFELASDNADELIKIVTCSQRIAVEKVWIVDGEESYKIIE